MNNTREWHAKNKHQFYLEQRISYVVQLFKATSCLTPCIRQADSCVCLCWLDPERRIQPKTAITQQGFGRRDGGIPAQLRHVAVSNLCLWSLIGLCCMGVAWFSSLRGWLKEWRAVLTKSMGLLIFLEPFILFFLPSLLVFDTVEGLILLFLQVCVVRPQLYDTLSTQYYPSSLELLASHPGHQDCLDA